MFFRRQYLVINELEAILDRRFPDEVRPSLLELEKNASLALHFGHPLILDGMRPVLPNYVYVGMMNCREPRPLPQDIADFLDAANEGVVYVSFGYCNDRICAYDYGYKCPIGF